MRPIRAGCGDDIGGATYVVGDDAPWCAGVRRGGEVAGGDFEVMWFAECVGGVAFNVAGVHGGSFRVCGGALHDDGGGVDGGGESAGIGRVIADIE